MALAEMRRIAEELGADEPGLRLAILHRTGALDVGEVAVVCELRRKGFSLEGVRKVMRFLDRELDKRLAEIVDRSSENHLLSDGTHLYLESSAKQDMDILKNSKQPVLGICLTAAVRQVRAGIASGKANTSVTSPDYRKRARKAS